MIARQVDKNKLLNVRKHIRANAFQQKFGEEM